MSDKTPDKDSTDDIDAQYRRAAALDPSRPGEALRRSILANAAKLAAQRSGATGSVDIDPRQPAANESRWRPAVFGTLAAAALAGLLITPHFLPPRTPPDAERATSDVTAKNSPAPQPPTTAEAPNVAAAPAPRSFSDVQQPAAQVAAPTAAIVPAAQHDARLARTVAPPAGPGVATDSMQAESTGAATAMNAMTARSAAPAAMAGATRAVDPGEALRVAAAGGDLAQIRALLDSNDNVDARDAQGRTALMLAILHGQAAAVDALLAHGADPGASDANGTTALQAAMAGNQAAIVAALRRAGALR